MFESELTFFWLAQVGYALAFSACLCGVIFAKPGAVRAGTALAGAGFLMHGAFLVARWSAQGHPPIVSLFELVCGGGWFAVMALLGVQLMVRKIPGGGVGTVVLPVVLLTMGAAYFINPELSTMSPALRSIWLYIHVFFALTAYGCLAIAAGGGAVYLVKARKLGNDPEAAERLARIDRFNHRFVLTGFVMTAVFVAAGAVWAHYAWGRYWGWDPVETASLCTWVVYGLGLHLWMKRKWKGRRAAWICMISFLLVLVCFWVIPFVMPITKHQYENI